MFDNNKRNSQINMHKKSAKKTFQYSLRLDREHYDMLHFMARRMTMADVINRALEVEFDYHKLMETLFQKMPNFKTTDDVDQWVVQISKSKPELLNKLAKASAINAYNNIQKDLLRIRLDYVNDLDTIGYFLNKIGVNINQLTKLANSGFSINKNDLSTITSQIVNINSSINLIQQELS